MYNWEYQITVHQFPELQCREEETIECDDRGRCFVHDACRGGFQWLEDIFQSKGKDGWELVQSGYHNKELLCIWKKPSEMKER